MASAEDLYLFVQHAAQWFRVLDAELGLTPARFGLLATLRYDGPQRLGRLATLHDVAQPTMTKLVAAAEQDGLVVRRPDPADARGALVDLTPEGRALVRRARARKITGLERGVREPPAASPGAAARVARAPQEPTADVGDAA